MPQLFYGQWVQQVSGTTENLNDVFAVTADLVFAVGNNGTILKTTDGGVNWVQKNSGITDPINKVQFIDENEGYALSELGQILKTVDSGNTWILIYSFPTLSFNYRFMSCINGNVLYYCQNYILYKSINGGISFQEFASPEFMRNIQFINALIGFAQSSGGLLKTVDGGLTWNIIKNDGFGSFYFLSENIGFVNTLSGLMKTIDGGISFTLLGSIEIDFKLLASNENVIWSMPEGCPLNGAPCYGTRGEILSSSNFQIENTFPFSSMHFINPTKGYAISFSKIYKNITGLNSLSNIDFQNQDNPVIFPNPSDNEINISFNGRIIELVEIIITDNLGKKVFEDIFPYSESIKINTKAFSKGLYFSTIIYGNRQQTQKLLIK